MVLSGLYRALQARGKNRSSHGTVLRRQPGNARTLRIEPLENRNLLSLTIGGHAVPDYVAYAAPGAVAPLATAGPTGYSPAQLRQAYGFDKITFNNGTVAGDGSGTTIAIVDAYNDPNIASDLHQFDVQFGLSDPVFTKVNETGGTSLPTANAGWSEEIALDVEWAHAIAPKANILLVEAASSSMGDLMTAVNYARNAAGVVAVSMSWGGGEFFGENSYDSYFTTPSGHSGVTFIASSGDSGAPASYPASSPNVLSVGGTSLYLNSQNGFSSESAWSGSGGGISAYESQPSYQKGVVTQSATYRTNPDVAYDANPSTGFAVYDSYGTPSGSPWIQLGGTSAGAPQWAALVAIADQGRALAGKAALNGPTQTLPAIYALSAADFHDTTSGSSAGRPSYSAGAGYDLVTGRGSPVANLVVNDLVGSSSTTTTSAVTHFSITAAPSTDTAGQSFSVTVTALDSSNNAVSGYLGTVQFVSSDGSAKLPTSYTFTIANKGVFTFSGVTLTTAGNETITVSDAANGSILGTAAILVNPAAVSRVAFGQQPAAAAPGGVISPAVTVQLFDAYGNLATKDNSDQVSVSIGSNPGGGTLSGTTTIAVIGGVATFGNLSINQPGTGYTLTASIPTLSAIAPVSSASFNVSKVAAGTTIEGFEGSSTYHIVGGSYPTATISTIAKHDGSYGLVDSNGSDWIYRNDSAVQVKQGDTISVWLQMAGTADGRAYFGFGAGPTGTLSLVAAPNTGQLLIQNNAGYGFTTIGSASETWQPNHWYRLEVDWGTSGTIIGKVFDSNGTTLLQTVTASTTVITSGGIAFRAIGSNKYWDTVQLTPSVNQFVGPASSVAARGTASIIGASVTSAPSTDPNVQRLRELAWSFAANELSNHDDTFGSTTIAELARIVAVDRTHF
jgi:hypothetical protein